jgi:hypothetical protein
VQTTLYYLKPNLKLQRHRDIHTDRQTENLSASLHDVMWWSRSAETSAVPVLKLIKLPDLFASF